MSSIFCIIKKPLVRGFCLYIMYYVIYFVYFVNLFTMNLSDEYDSVTANAIVIAIPISIGNGCGI